VEENGNLWKISQKHKKFHSCYPYITYIISIVSITSCITFITFQVICCTYVFKSEKITVYLHRRIFYAFYILNVLNVTKEEKINAVKKYLSDHENGVTYGLYIKYGPVFQGDPEDAVYVGDALGPMSPYRYKTIDEYYDSIKNKL